MRVVLLARRVVVDDHHRRSDLAGARRNDRLGGGRRGYDGAGKDADGDNAVHDRVLPGRDLGLLEYRAVARRSARADTNTHGGRNWNKLGTATRTLQNESCRPY